MLARVASFKVCTCDSALLIYAWDLIEQPPGVNTPRKASAPATASLLYARDVIGHAPRVNASRKGPCVRRRLATLRTRRDWSRAGVNASRKGLCIRLRLATVRTRRDGSATGCQHLEQVLCQFVCRRVSNTSRKAFCGTCTLPSDMALSRFLPSFCLLRCLSLRS